MVSEWPEVPLSKIAKLRSGFPFKSASWIDSGVPVIKISNVKNGRIVKDGCGFVSEEVAASVPEWMTKDGDILIAMTGYVGEVAFVRANERYLINQRVGRFDFFDDSPVLPGFFFCYLRVPEIRAYIEDLARGSAQPNLSAGDAAKLMVPVPPIAEQRAIAETLGALDDRIDNLRQTNATLQAIAASLFKSLFVYFDGVPPRDMQESELGLIPKGWQMEEIGKLVQCVGGATPSTKDETFWNGGIHHWATPKDLSDLQAPILIATERRITDAGLTRISSALLPAGTLLMSSRAPIGYLAIAAVPVAINQGFIAMLPGGALSPVWLLFWAQANMEAIKQKANGSTFMEISKAAFRPIKVALPPPDALAQFDEVAAPMLERIQNNERHIATLAAIRDALLPRLLSGQLRVPQ